MKRRHSLLLLCPFFLLSVLSVSAGDLSSFANQSGVLKIAGGTAHIPVMKEMSRLIMERYPDIRITIAGGGSGVGIKQVGEGMIDIGNAGREATAEEISSYGLHQHQWATDGVGAVVNPANPVKSLNSAELQAVFAGRITNWKELGGEDRAINLYGRDAASGTRSVFWKKALAKGEVSKKANVVPSNGAMKSAIASDPYGIGYVSVGHIDETVFPVSLDGVTPTLETVKSGAYPVARGLYSLTKGEPAGLVKCFIDALYTETARHSILDKGYIPTK